MVEQSSAQVYSEVYGILNSFGTVYINAIPKKLYNLINENRDKTFNPTYNMSIPLQNPRALSSSQLIVILPVLSAEDIDMKYRDGTKFVATLVDGQGKAYAGQNVTFNINGVFYNRLTDGNGQAKLNINLMAGEYIITSSYNGSNIANKITIRS